MSPNYRSQLKSLFFSSFESIFVVSLNYCRFGFAGHLGIQNSIVQSFEHLEITEQQFTTWTSNNCFPFSIHKFVSDIKLHQKKSLAWRQHTLDIQWLELQVVPSPLISTFRIIKIHEKHPKKNYAFWSGFYAFWLGFYAVSFSFHWDSKFMPRRCIQKMHLLSEVAWSNRTAYLMFISHATLETITQIIDYESITV